MHFGHQHKEILALIQSGSWEQHIAEDVVPPRMMLITEQDGNQKAGCRTDTLMCNYLGPT